MPHPTNIFGEKITTNFNNNPEDCKDDEGNIDTTTCPEVTLIYER